MNYKIDLHTHSIISRDGGITADQYKQILEKGMLDCVAITDHNDISFARAMQEELGSKIIIGEEITTTDGELVGLFLQEKIPAGLTAQKTVEAIHKQGGLVYLPHPFETLRKGLQREVVEKLVKEIDIVEVFNARGRFRGKAGEAEAFAQSNSLSPAASSDAHGAVGLGSAFSIVSQMPSKSSLVKLLREGKLQKTYAPLWTYLYPMINRIKHAV